jgi:hypothetical protein
VERGGGLLHCLSFSDLLSLLTHLVSSDVLSFID